MCEGVLVLCSNFEKVFISVNQFDELLVSNEKDETTILCAGVSNDFDVISERNGNISIMIVTLEGVLLYIKYSFGNIEKKIVLDSKTTSKKINKVKLIKINGWFHVFYTIEHEEKTMLVHHISSNNGLFSKPVVIDYVDKHSIFHISADKSYNLHIVYADEGAKLKYTTFINSKKSYSLNILDCKDKIRSINTVFSDDKLYGVYLSKEHGYTVITCINFSTGERKTVSITADTIDAPCIFPFNNSLHVQWYETGNAFESISNEKLNFSKPVSLGYAKQIIKIRSFADESVSLIDRCPSDFHKKPFLTAKKVFESINAKKDSEFMTKGLTLPNSEKQFASGAKRIHDFDSVENIEHLLNRLVMIAEKIAEVLVKSQKNILLQNVGEIDKGNLEKFEKLEFSGHFTENINNDNFKNEEE